MKDVFGKKEMKLKNSNNVNCNLIEFTKKKKILGKIKKSK